MRLIQAVQKEAGFTVSLAVRLNATHCLNRGTNPKAIQEVMGHKSLETTMGYLHAEALSVASPLDG